MTFNMDGQSRPALDETLEKVVNNGDDENGKGGGGRPASASRPPRSILTQSFCS